MCDQCEKDISGLAREWAKARHELVRAKKFATIDDARNAYERMLWLTRQLEDVCLPSEDWQRADDDLAWTAEMTAKFGKALHA